MAGSVALQGPQFVGAEQDSWVAAHASAVTWALLWALQAGSQATLHVHTLPAAVIGLGQRCKPIPGAKLQTVVIQTLHTLVQQQSTVLWRHCSAYSGHPWCISAAYNATHEHSLVYPFAQHSRLQHWGQLDERELLWATRF
eukprot:2787321-Lingulodinium_polyedra.AAC.1